MSDAVTKQVIVVRSDLKMRRGKEVAQGAHASGKWLRLRLRSVEDEMFGIAKLSLDEAAWLSGDQRKVCVRVRSEEELRDVWERARAAGLEAHLVTDIGLTEFRGVPTATACAVGPVRADLVDEVTGGRELY